MWNLEKWYWWSYLQSRNRDTDVENTCMKTKGGRGSGINYIGTHTHTHIYGCAQLLQSCLTLCDLMYWSPPGSSVHGILQSRILKWIAMPFSRGSLRPRDWIWATGGKKKNIYIYIHTQPERRKWLSTLVFLLGNPMDRGNCWLQRTGGLQSMGLQKVRHDWPSSSSLLLCIKWITSECLLDSLGNSALWADLNGREIRQWGASVYVHLSHCAVRQELTQSCGATVLQQ